jgi:hypothetical protein
MDAINRLGIPKREEWLRIGRYAIPILLGLVILLVLGIFLWSSVPRDPLEIASEKIERGMSTNEAREIVERLDVPAGTIRGREHDPNIMIFHSDQGLLLIHSMDDQVIKKTYNSGFRRKSFFDRLRRWLGL